MRFVSITLGWVFVAIGVVGAFMPVLPTTPFLLLAAFFFAHGSAKFHDRLTQSDFYVKHVQSTVQNGQMPIKTKIRIVATAYTMLLVPLITIDVFWIRAVIIGCMIIILITFTWFIKNKPAD